MEADDGTIGDAYDEVRPGEKMLNVTYEELFDAGGGVLVVGRNGKE